MEDKNFQSVEELDAYLEEQNFGETPETPEEDVTQETIETSTEPDKAEEQTKEDGENSQVTEEPTVQPKQKYTKEEQRNYAFQKLSRERKSAMEEAQHYKDFMQYLANRAGINDIAVYEKALRDKFEAEDAKNKGISPEIYRAMQSQKRQIKDLQRVNAEREQHVRFSNFQNTLANIKNQYNFNDDDISEMFSNLEKAGFRDANQLLAQPNPEMLIRGALMDKIIERSIQLQREKEAKAQPNVDVERIDTVSEAHEYDEDAEIKREMEEYARENGFVI